MGSSGRHAFQAILLDHGIYVQHLIGCDRGDVMLVPFQHILLAPQIRCLL